MTFAFHVRARSLAPRLLLFAALSSCTQPRAATPPSGPPAPSPSRDAATATPFQTRELASLPGSILLYDAERWRATESGSFAVLEHAASKSTLAIRVWRSARLVRPAECEAEARLVRPSLPKVDPDAIVDSRALEAPAGFSGSLVVGVEPALDGATHGFALAVGAAVGQCFVLAFDTHAEGVDAPSTVAERLRALADHVAPSVTLRAIDERVHFDRELK